MIHTYFYNCTLLCKVFLVGTGQIQKFWGDWVSRGKLENSRGKRPSGTLCNIRSLNRNHHKIIVIPRTRKISGQLPNKVVKCKYTILYLIYGLITGSLSTDFLWASYNSLLVQFYHIFRLSGSNISLQLYPDLLSNSWIDESMTRFFMASFVLL